jgi:anti-sigma B factor antagonist
MGRTPLKIDEARLDNLIVLRPAGRLDNQTAPEFQAKLLGVTAGDTADVVIDLAAVEYISSGGLRALGTAAKQMRAGRRIAVCGLHALVLDVFSIAHFEQVLPIFANLDDARLAWAEPPRSRPRDGGNTGT